jgi:hypothetical protein
MGLKKRVSTGTRLRKRVSGGTRGSKRFLRGPKKSPKLVASGSVTKTMTTMVHQMFFITYDTMKFENINKTLRQLKPISVFNCLTNMGRCDGNE